VSFERCFVRGSGDLVWCRASRPFRLEASQTLAALAGSLLTVDAGKPEEGEGDTKAAVELNRVTAVVGGHLLHLRRGGNGLKGIVPLRFGTADCLFASTGGKAMVHVAGGEITGEAVLLDRFGWRGSGNAYHFPGMMVEHQPGGVGMSTARLQPYDREKWKTLTGEMDATFVETIKFGEVPSNLARARPETFAAVELRNFGAPPEQVPAPSK
jgi:hypothetical protein